MKHLTEEQLNGIADGTLPPSSRPKLEQHRSECLTCRAEIARIRTIAVRISALPSSMEPPADVWPMISTRIRNVASAGDRKLTTFNGRTPAWGWLAAAAVLLVVISSAVTTLVVGTRQTPRAVS
ncbi:MAG: hypothetical protein ACR2G6_07515, partial [Gemmatimonadaceae bacterium]